MYYIINIYIISKECTNEKLLNNIMISINLLCISVYYIWFGIMFTYSYSMLYTLYYINTYT